MTDTPDRTFAPAESVCPFCGVGCGIQYSPKKRGSLGWRGPVNRRGEICVKGAAAFDHVVDDDRLTRPLVRENGVLVPTTWEVALSRVEREFGPIVDEFGPDSLAFFASSNCTNEENYLLQKLARLLGTNNVDNCARLCHSSTVAAMRERFGAGAMTNSLDDLTEADVFLVVGANPAENHPIIFQSYLRPALSAGATLIHVDPRETATTAAADHHLPVRPGHDIPLLNALAAVVLNEGLVDDAFVAERTTGFETLREFLDAVDVDANADLSGVDTADVRAAARAYGEADRAAIVTGMGTSQHHYGTDNVHALLNLALLTGNVGRRGTGVNPLRGQNNVQGAGDVGALPDTLPGYRDVTDGEARQALADEWGVAPPETPGLTEVELTHAFGDSVRGAFVFGENPAITEPNATRIAEKLDALDCLVVLDLFVTETAEHADVVLPGSAWAEKSGTVTNTDRQVMRMRPNADLPGEARRDFDVLCALGQRLVGRVRDCGDDEFGSGDEFGPDDELASGDDRSEQFDYGDPEAVFEEITRTVPQYAGMSYAGIGTGSQRWPFDAASEDGSESGGRSIEGEGIAVLHTDRFENGSKTASLRVVEHVPPADAVDDDELVLTTGRVLQQFNSGAITRRSGVLTRLRGTPALQIHPTDAEARDIVDGDEVRVENERGRVAVVAAVTPAIRQGTVFLAFHDADPPANRLTGDALDPVAKIPEYKHAAVRVSRIDDE